MTLWINPGSVKLRISTEPREGQTLIRVDGELANEGVAELRETCAGIGGPAVLDLSGLNRLDVDGVRLLRALAAQGKPFRDANPYISLLLNENADRV